MIVELTTALGALKTTNELIRGVLAADKALGEAELKLRLADAATTPLDARTAVLDAQAAIDAKDKEIESLQNALVNRAKVVRKGNAYYEMKEDGEPAGDGYCMRCFEHDHKLFHLMYPAFMNEGATCAVCKTKYNYYNAAPIQEA